MDILYGAVYHIPGQRIVAEQFADKVNGNFAKAIGSVIGEITLMRCPNIKTVVNKTEKLHNVYRTPTL